MDPDATLSRACDVIPGLLQGVLVLLPEGLVLGGIGKGGSYDREPLARSAARCLACRLQAPIKGARSLDLVEHLFVCQDELVVILQGRRSPRLALAVTCSRELNLALILTAARRALGTIEASVDLVAWGV